MKISRNIILNYLKGILSKKERHAFEKLMLEDPFLNDAVEGLQNIENPETIDVLLDELDQQVQTNSGKKVSPGNTGNTGNTRWMMAVAVAAILIIAITSVVVLYFPKNIQNDNLSFNQVPETSLKEETEDVGTEIETIETIKNEDEQITGEKEEQITGVDEEKILEETVEQPVVSANVASMKDSVVMDLTVEDDIPDVRVSGDLEIIAEAETEDELIAFDDAKVAEKIERDEESTEPMAAMAKEVQGGVESKSRKKSKIQENVLNGLVNETSGEAIEGVNVLVVDRKDGAITNKDGAFQIRDFSPELTLIYTKPGYLDIEEVTSGSVIEMSLDKGYEPAGYEILNNDGTYFDQVPVPITGRVRYLKYLIDRISLINTELNIQESIQVQAEFEINTQGEINDLDLSSELDTTLSERILEMISEGPKWLPAIVNGQNINSRIRITVIIGNR